MYRQITSLDIKVEVRVIDALTKDVLGLVLIPLKEYHHQNKIDKYFQLKSMNTPGGELGSIRMRVRVFWSKLQYYQNQIEMCDDKIENAKKDSVNVQGYLDLLEKPFGLIVYGQVNNIRDEDLLEPPKDKEEIVDKKRMSVLPNQRINSGVVPSFANKIDQAFKGTLSKNIIINSKKLMFSGQEFRRS